MKNIELIKMTIRNFKGISYFEFFPNSKSTNVYGKNATGKSTLADAWFWLLFDKDTSLRGSNNFAIKPVKNGEEIHHLETSVVAKISIDGEVYELMKFQKEKWTKKRGSNESEYAGNVSEYLIDGVPAKQKDWKEFVASIVDEETFKILSLSSYFNEGLDWKKRRELLFLMLGNELITPLNLAQQDNRFNDVLSLLEKHSLEDARKKTSKQILDLRKRIADIPIRIDEQTREKATINLDECSKAENEITLKKGRISQIDAIISGTQEQQENIQCINNKISIIEQLKVDKINKKRTLLLKDFFEGREAFQKSKYAKEETWRDIEYKKAQIESLSLDQTDITTKLDSLRNEFFDIKNENYVQPDWGSEVCPTCGKELDNKSTYEIEEHEKNWNYQKVKRLEANKEKGTLVSGKLEDLKKQISTLEFELLELKQLLEVQTKKENEFSQFDIDPPTPVIEIDFSKEDSDIQALKDSILSIQNTDVKDLRLEKARLNNEVEELQAVIVKKERLIDIENRIIELEIEEKQESNLLMGIEQQRDLLDELVKMQCEKIEGTINAKFDGIQWKMFATQINGGVVDCCECLVNGVPYPDANNAARINAGLSIADSFSRFSGVAVPVFVDNAESVNEIFKLDCPIIMLIVSNHNELTIEVEKEMEVA